MKTSIFASALLAALSAANPIEKRQDLDVTILQYALTLEHLEATFYASGLAKFSQADFVRAGFGKDMYDRLRRVAMDEATHVSVLESVLTQNQQTPTQQCTYNFGFNTPRQFVHLASLLEGVGVSAYLGAAPLISNKGYLTAAGSILTVEARHNAFLRQAQDLVPFPTPFDTPLGFSQVYSLAAPFITSCPSSNPTLPVTAFPSLTPKSQGLHRRGKIITFKLAANFNFPASGTPVYVAWPGAMETVYVPATINQQARTVVASTPAYGYGGSGQAFAILTTSKNQVADSNTLAGPAIVSLVSPMSFQG